MSGRRHARPARFVCLVHHEQEWFDRVPQAEIDALARRSLAYDDELAGRGRLVVAHALRTRDTARIVRVREGKATVTDGPFTETKEQLLGFLLVEAADMDEAIEIARGVPLAATGTIEVRQVYAVG